jgi:hypothetical protein
MGHHRDKSVGVSLCLFRAASLCDALSCCESFDLAFLPTTLERTYLAQKAFFNAVSNISQLVERLYGEPTVNERLYVVRDYR